MKKQISIIICILCMLAGCMQTMRVSANKNMIHVYDEAQLLTDAEERELQLFAAGYESKGIAVVFLTIDDAQGYSSMTYSDDFYDTHAFGTDGVLFMIDMDNREVYINTVGRCIGWLEYQIDEILDETYIYAGEGRYYTCLKETSRLACKVIDAKLNPLFALPQYGLVIILVAAGITLIVVLVLLAKHRSSNVVIQASRYMERGFKVKSRDEVFLGCRDEVLYGYYRQDTSSSGGGGGSHRSSGGISHGGGGRKF